MRPKSKNSLKAICFHTGEKKTGERDESRKHAIIERDKIKSHWRKDNAIIERNNIKSDQHS